MIPLIAAISLVILGSASGCNEKQGQTEETTQDAVETAVEEEMTDAKDSGPEVTANGPKVKISTSFGDMVLELYDNTPQHRDNFIKLVQEEFYNDLLFHRVMGGFMIQGGDPNSRGAEAGQPLGSGGPGYTVEAEFNSQLYHQKGALAAARQPDRVNPEKRSSGSQFYIVQGGPWTKERTLGVEKQINMKRDSANYFHYTDEMMEVYSSAGGTPFLDQEYTVFGQVIEGMEVIDKIAAVETLPGDRPKEDVKMTLTVIE
jgi:peptidyl-prolyl cis-trans isomerase B (cyclophilin B)